MVIERSGITRGARACDACRRMKTRCILEGTAPCKRCQSIRISCVVSSSSKGPTSSPNARRSLTASGSDRRSAPSPHASTSTFGGSEGSAAASGGFTGEPLQTKHSVRRADLPFQVVINQARLRIKRLKPMSPHLQSRDRCRQNNLLPLSAN